MRGRLFIGAASAAFIIALATPTLAQEADQPGDSSTQARIDAGGAIEAQLSPAEDVDWFRLRAEQGLRYRITLDAAPAEGEAPIDPVLLVRDGGGNELAFNDDSGGTLNAALHFTHGENADVFIEARGFNPQATGRYRLSVEAAPLPPDDAANDASTRAVITPGRPVSGAIEYEGDVDWYRFRVREGQIYRISLNGAEGASGALGDPLLRVLSSAGEELAFNDDGPEGLNSYLEFVPQRSADVFVEARAYGDAYTGGYSLAVEAVRLPNDNAAPSTRTRARIAVGGTVNSALDFPGDRDWYRIRLTGGETYRFSLTASGDPAVGDPLLRLYDARGNEVAMDDDGGGGLNSLLEYTAPSTGAYFVEARGYTQDATGGYTLRAMAGDIPADATSDVTLSAGGDYRQGVLSPAGDRDWYRVDLEAGQALRISLMSAEVGEALADPFIVFYGPNGQEVARDDDGGENLNAFLEYEAAESGPHYLEVRGFDEGAAGAYVIGIVPGEIGADADGAEHLSPNTRRQSRIGADGDVDWFVVELIEGRAYRFSLAGAEPDALADPYLTLYNSEGREIAADDDGGPGLGAYLSFVPVTGGPYFLAASSFGGTGSGSYVIQAVDTEVPGHIYTEEVLDPAGDTRASRIDMPGDLDYFQVQLEAGVRYQIDVSGAGDYPLADPYLVLLDAQNIRIVSDDDGGPGLDARLRFTPSASGVYFVQASGLGGSVGTYQVSITRR